MTERPARYTPAATPDAATILNAAVTERQLQNKIIYWAQCAGWLVFHPWTSVHSAPGFPDLIMVKGGRLLALELKTLRGRLRPEQQRWLAELGRVPGCTALVVRPGDEDLIERVLAR